MARVVKIEPESHGAVCRVQFQTVDSLNNQKLLRRSINKTVILVANEMI